MPQHGGAPGRGPVSEGGTGPIVAECYITATDRPRRPYPHTRMTLKE